MWFLWLHLRLQDFRSEAPYSRLENFGKDVSEKFVSFTAASLRVVAFTV